MKAYPEFLPRQFSAAFLDAALIGLTIEKSTGTVAATSSDTFRTHLEVIS
jgi:hypothetical protein